MSNNKQNISKDNDDEIIKQLTPMIKDLEKDLENVNDIKIKPPSADELTKFLNLIKNMPRNSINDLIDNLDKLDVINPNKNEFHTCTKKNMIQYYFKKYKKQQQKHLKKN